jgi:cell fate regulator YaaT (PSP1 superfamily)
LFRNGSKTDHFDPDDIELSRGDRVVVRTLKGTEIAQVVESPHDVEDSELRAPLSKVVRVANAEDLSAEAEDLATRKQAMATCRELIAEHKLDMKLVDAEVSLGGDKIVFSFYSDDRVDFRTLVADLAKTLKSRIELRQIGAREEARMIGGIGPCGRRLCCTLFAGDEDPVSIRMAKEQSLPLNPMKISGLCGRLMCCLKYEQEQYVTFRKEAPAKGTHVSTETAQGVVSGYNVVKEALNVRFEDGTHGEVRLCNCERCEDGSLCCTTPEPPTPEADKSYEIAFTTPRRAAGPDDAEAGEVRETEDAVATGQVQPAGESQAQTANGESAEGKQGRSRSRRSRGHRNRGKAQNGPDGAVATGPQTGEQPGAQAQPNRPPSQRNQRQRSQGGGQPGATPASSPADGQGQPAAGGDGQPKPRRRRRPRRRPGGSGGAGAAEGGGGSASSGGGEASS